MSAEDLDAVAVGDVVQVSDGSRRMHEGTVTKVGTKLVHIERYGRVDTYYRAGGRRRDGYPGYFRTAARVADDEARANAAQRLRRLGVELGRVTNGWSTALLVELAETVERLAGSVTP